ncbi:hypothetical protein V6N13_032771 [Hibiscus sabdariffa]|uniref:Uncharacterized protein n=1 Tax=Hibiscus sabdariffa TaxID=183260 RepID=A0ABR2FC70_9ROSI
MAYVFGNAITDATLRAMPEFQGKKTTLQDKARVALTLKHSDGKDVTVREQVQNLTAGGERTTICLIYNATGDTLTLVSYQDWSGRVGSSPYPPGRHSSGMGSGVCSCTSEMNPPLIARSEPSSTAAKTRTVRTATGCKR